jgi:hypothetical protein
MSGVLDWQLAPPPGAWTSRGSCVEFSAAADAFTDARTALDGATAIKICAHCPVTDECLDYGHESRGYGVWGGMVLRDGIPT